MKSNDLVNWPFQDQPRTAVIANKKVVSRESWIAYVTHDLEDGGWQFHTNEATIREDDAILLSLKNIVDIDPSIGELSDLPVGWHAWREAIDLPWKRAKMS